MEKIGHVYKSKGRKRVRFNELGVYYILKEKLGFRYTKIEEKGYYLQENNGIYEIIPFERLKQSFKDFLEAEFSNLDISREITFHDFINEYYDHSPIKKGNYSRQYLGEGFQLSEINQQMILEIIRSL